MNAVDLAQRLIGQGGQVHLIGAGGIGMAGIAFLLKERGLTVTGCDVQQNRQTEWLARCGIPVFAGHGEEHLGRDSGWIIRTTAVPDSHPEVVRARALGLPVVRRGEALPALMRERTCIAVSGTHGKTTTTAMIAQVLGCGFCIGGEIAGMEGVARDAPLMAVEADESDGTVAGYAPDYAVITNIEYDHMEHHASEEAFIDCFRTLIRNTKQKVFYCADDPISGRVCAGDPKCEAYGCPEPPFPLPVPGRHNQWNAAAAQAVCRLWKSDGEILQALQDMRPVRRRFETVFNHNGIRVISDYAHHPSEVAACIRTAREMKPARLLAVFQPHRYTRTRALGAAFPAAFDGVDRLWLVPVYAASEEPVAGGTVKDLMNHFPESVTGRLHCCETLDAAWNELRAELREGDLLLVIGAGDIGELADRARDWT